MDTEKANSEPLALANPLPANKDFEDINLGLDDADGDFGDFQTFADSTEESSLSQVPNLDSPTTYTSSSSSPSTAPNSSVSSPAHQLSQSSSASFPKYPNIYEMDMFAFQEYVTNFEEQLVHIFVPLDSQTLVAIKPSSTVDGINFSQNNPPEELFAFDHSKQQSFSNAASTLFPKNSPTSPIHSQEDIINDCPIWYNLTGSYNCTQPLQFFKSTTFKRYISSLEPMSQKFSKPKRKLIKARKGARQTYADLPANMKNSRLKLISSQELNDLHETLQTTNGNAGNSEDDEDDTSESMYDEEGDNSGEQHFDEEELANDLDMHSLIVGQNPNNNAANSNSTLHKNSKNQNKDAMAVSADEIIEELETMMEDGTKANKKTTSNPQQEFEYPQKQASVADPMLSLNAASLLDAAIQTWQNNFADDEGAEGYHSLPANLNCPEPGDLLPESKLAHNNQNINSKDQTRASNEQNQSKALLSAPSKTTTNSSNLEKLNRLSIAQLNELYMELEQIIQLRSEVLISELALRDELEYEKEMKNQFISLLLSVQNKRRYYTSNSSSGSVRSARMKQVSKSNANNNRLIRRNSTHNGTVEQISSPTTSNRLMSRARMLDLSALGSSLRESFRFASTTGNGSSGSSNPVYLTTVIPYQNGMTVDTATLQLLIKLLTAMDENSSTVPSLLTDYILKVICP